MKTFSERVIAIARSIPAGRVTTYGRISLAAGGGSMSSQSITGILGRAYDAGIHDIPFHRIVYADGRVWMDEAHSAARLKLYASEKLELDEKGRIKDFAARLFDFR